MVGGEKVQISASATRRHTPPPAHAHAHRKVECTYTSGIAHAGAWTSGASSGVIYLLIIAVVGVLHPDARDDPHPHASAVVDSRMPRQVSCEWGSMGITRQCAYETLSHALLLVCACGCGCVWMASMCAATMRGVWKTARDCIKELHIDCSSRIIRHRIDEVDLLG